MRDRVKYYSILLGSFAALEILLNAAVHRGVDNPTKNIFRPGEWLVDQRLLSPLEWKSFSSRHDVLLALTFVPIVSGATTVLPNDFNILSNLIFGIGSGFAGLSGSNQFGGSGGGNGGGGGAYASVRNYSAHIGGQTVNIQVGTGDSIFDSSSVLVAKAASGTTGGQASACVGDAASLASGGNAGIGGTSLGAGGSGGGGGGGAAGPSGVGSTGANGQSAQGTGGVAGGAGGNANSNVDSGGTPGPAGGGSPSAGGTGASGQEFDATHGCGGGGGGGGGAGIGGQVGGNGGNAGGYGGGGAGGGGTGSGASGGNGGNAFQGLLGIQYTPAGTLLRSYGFILG